MEIFSLLGDFEMENDSSASMEAMMGFSGFGECLIALLHVDHLESCWNHADKVNLRTETLSKNILFCIWHSVMPHNIIVFSR